MKNQRIQTEPLYYLRDTELAFVLYTQCKLDSYEWRNGVCWFVFEDKDRCDVVINKHLNDKLKVSTKTTLDAMRTIKGIVLRGRDN
jgi:hypothetical protein|tara:strand:+ start:7035 stop:7292 length:258 start_codon:yes stop_codon:yes gene_type:complete